MAFLFKNIRKTSYVSRLKLGFILFYGCVGFVSTSCLLLLFLFQKTSGDLYFNAAVVIVIPAMLFTIYFAYKAKVNEASLLALATLFLGCFGAVTLRYSAFLSLLMILVLSVLFITFNKWQIITGFTLLISTAILKLLVEAGMITIGFVTRSDLEPTELIYICVFLFSIFTYALILAVTLSRGLKNSEKLFEVSSSLRREVALKERFFSIIAHDLRGPAGATYITLRALASGDIEPDEDLLEELYDASRNSYFLLENLLDWSRNQRGELILSKEEFSICVCLANVIELLSYQSKVKKIQIKTNCGDEFPVNADQSTICTILRNLVGNALKYSFEGSKIEISIEQNPQHTKVNVQDFGIGIAPDAIPLLFEMNERRTARPGTANEQGSGMGLLLAKEFVDANGGEIGVESNPGEGSLFWFTIPAV